MDNSENVFTEENLKIFASRIKLLRTERKLSHTALGKIFGCSRSKISSYECAVRVPDIKVLYTYAEFFDVSTDYLLGKTNIRKPLSAIACFSNLTDEDIGNWTDEMREDISNFIAFRSQQEALKKNKQI